MNPIISGKKEKTKPFLVFAMISLYIASIVLFLIIINGIITRGNEYNNSTVIIAGNGNAFVHFGDDVSDYLESFLAALFLIFGFVISIFICKHKSDEISVFDNNISIKIGKTTKEINFNNITECKYKDAKYLGCFITITEKSATNKNVLYNISNADKISEIINSKI